MQRRANRTSSMDGGLEHHREHCRDEEGELRLFGGGQMHEFFRVEFRHYQRARAADQRGQKECS